MPLEFIQELLKEATMLGIEGEKQFISLSCVLGVAMRWEERAGEILSLEASISDFEDMIRASENIFVILASLNDVEEALSEANSWLRNSRPYLVSSNCASNSVRKVEDLQLLVSQSKHLKVSLEERRMLELVLNNCKKWECEAHCLHDDVQCLFELDNTVHGISSDLLFEVEDFIARIQSAIASGVSLGFDFSDISKLQASCSTLEWCKRALCFCNHSPSLKDVLEVVEGLSNSSVSGALLNVLVDGVEWLRRALEGISRPCNSRRCKLTDIQDILTDYRTIKMTFTEVNCQLEEAIGKHRSWQEQVHQFYSLSSSERTWSSILQLKELGDTIAFRCPELNLILSEVEKVENWMKRCMDNVGPLFQNENSLLHALQKINGTLDKSLYIYGKLQNQKEPNLCNCCFLDSEDQEFLTCSTCMDCYHLQCIGLTAKDTGLGDYKCSYCEILKGKSQDSNGSSLLRFEKHIELNILVKLLSDAEHFCFWIDERDLLNQLIVKGFACKSAMREIVNLSSAYVDEDITIISEKLTIAIKASKVAVVYDQGGNCDLELALARYLWKIQVNILLSSEQKPAVEQIQKHLKEGLSMEISPKDHYMLKLTNVNCLGLHWVELAKKISNDSGELGLDKVYELVVEGENLPVDVNEELRMLRARCMLYCICRKPFDPGRMIACYQCNEWYHFDCMKLSCTQDIYICPACSPCTGLPTNHDRLTSGKLEEPKTPSPRHTNPRKKQKRDMFAPRSEDGSDFRYSNGTKCPRWKNRKPFRRVTKRRVELQSLSPFLCIKR